MTQTTTVLGLFGAFALFGAAEARGQQPSPASAGFINVNVGAQPQRRTISTSSSFSLYDEAVTVTSNQPIQNGVLLDLSAGYRAWGRFGIGVGLSSFRSRGDSGIRVSIPDPAFFDRPTIVTRDEAGLDRTELGLHLQAVWFTPVSEKFDIAFSAGPSFIRVNQEVAAVTIPARTQTVNVTHESQSGTALGINVGVDGSYMFRPRFGAGIFIRYAGGSVDLPAVSNLKVGGFQGGVGLRFRF